MFFGLRVPSAYFWVTAGVCGIETLPNFHTLVVRRSDHSRRVWRRAIAENPLGVIADCPGIRKHAVNFVIWSKIVVPVNWIDTCITPDFD